MDIRPTDLPELRAESLLWQASSGDKMMTAWANLASDYGLRTAPDFSRGMWRYEIERLGSAELFYITKPMVAVAMSAATSLPSFRIEPADLPAKTGLMVFEEPLPTGIHWDDGDSSVTRALLWSISDRLMSVGGVLVTSYLDRDAFNEAVVAPAGHRRVTNVPTLMPMPNSSFTSGFGALGWSENELHPGTSSGDLLPTLLAAWLLMQQPLSRTVDIEPDRAARKRLRRAGHEPKPVRVIELRRPKSSGEQGDGESNYQHQWIVRGHWRNHWHPKREVHRPVWIAPHVKGPEGAPMIGGEKVYAWKR